MPGPGRAFVGEGIVYPLSIAPLHWELDFPKDISSPPRGWAERFFNVQRWTEMPRGGHFAALEEPKRLAEDMREFFRPLRRSM